jgi:hypothetical protein
VGTAGGPSKSCRWLARGCGIVIVLVHIVRTREEAGHGDAAQFEQHANRQARDGDNIRVGGLGTSHPGRHCQRRAIGPPHDIVDFVVKVVHPDHWEAVRAQGMVVVVDRDFGGALLMGSMSFSCSKRSNKI